MRWLILLGTVLLASSVAAEWPGYGGNPARDRVGSGPEPPLVESWSWSSPHPPNPAWPGPAKWDAYNKVHDLKSRLAFDAVDHVAIGPELIYIGSSSDDQVRAIDRATGDVRWSFYTDGPVRFAPWLEGDHLLVGSDDGCLYCLDASTGELKWKQRPAGIDRRIPGNGRIISAWPIRTGPVVMGDEVYCTAGLFPAEGVHVCAYSIDDGTLRWAQRFEDLPAQGYILASNQRLYVPTSRDAPVIFDRTDGTRLGKAGGEGGTWALLTGETLVYGPGKKGSVGVHDASKGDQLANFAGNHLIVTPAMSFLHSDSELVGLDRTEYLRLAGEHRLEAARRKELTEQLSNQENPLTSEQRIQVESDAIESSRRIDELDRAMRDCFKWRASCQHPYSILNVGNVVYTGGDDEVAAYDITDGSMLWSAPVKGTAHGLAVEGDQLIVTTDTGAMHCFTTEASQ